jgi:hypothetical protein
VSRGRFLYAQLVKEPSPYPQLVKEPSPYPQLEKEPSPVSAGIGGIGTSPEILP